MFRDENKRIKYLLIFFSLFCSVNVLADVSVQLDTENERVDSAQIQLQPTHTETAQTTDSTTQLAVGSIVESPNPSPLSQLEKATELKQDVDTMQEDGSVVYTLPSETVDLSQVLPAATTTEVTPQTETGKTVAPLAQAEAQSDTISQDNVIQAEKSDPLAELLTISVQEAINRLGLTDDGNRRYDDSNLNTLFMATPFHALRFISLFNASDFADGKLRTLTDAKIEWKNQADPNYQVVRGESFCNTRAKGAFEVTVSAKLEGYLLQKTYLLSPKPVGICYIKPLSLAVNNKAYNSQEFNVGSGFSAGIVPPFPTTGFANAAFDIVLNTQFPREYRLQSTYQGKGVDVSGYFGESRVTIQKLPNMGTVRIDLLNEYGQIVDGYRFRITKWFINSGDQSFSYFDSATKNSPAIDFCGIYSQKESQGRYKNRYKAADVKFITNSLYKANQTNRENHFRRTSGQSLLAEWGNLMDYPNSSWQGGFYWLPVTQGSNALTIFLRTGQIVPQPQSAINPITCAYIINYTSPFLGQ